MTFSRIFLFIAVLSCASSCKTDQELKLEAQTRAKERLDALDFNSVDHYPLFEACDEVTTGANCFYEQLHKLVAERLAPVASNFTMSENDTMMVSMVVEANGRLYYEKLTQCPKHLDTIQIDSILKSRLQYLPRLSSAIKQDVPVKTMYKLPIILVPTDSINAAPAAVSTPQ